MSDQLQTSQKEVCGYVSAFYLALWEYMDGFSDQSRWLRASETAPIKFRTAEIYERLTKLREMKIGEIWLSTISDECDRTILLAEKFLQVLQDRESDVELRGQINDWKATLQNFGLEYARLEAKPESSESAVGV